MSHFSLFEIARIARTNWPILVLVPFLAMAAAAGTALVRPATWMAESRFMPQTKDDGGNSRLAGFAAQFGFAIGSAGAGESIDFYHQLIRSRTLLQDAAFTQYELGRQRLSLAEFLDERNTRDQPSTATAVAQLRERVHVLADPRSNLVTIQVSMTRPDLAEAVNRRLLDLVNTFNVEKRQTSAATERQFVETAQQEAARELHEAERALERFHIANVRFENSPQLMLQEARLQRVVQTRQEVHVSLTQAYEQARIDEIRNTPVITILDQPEGSARLTSSTPAQSAFTGAFWGILLALALVATREFVDQQRRADRLARAGLDPEADRLRVPAAASGVQ
jgi:uncharacterized protein involved in exopolysaccharide biosynthesis